MIKRKNTAWSYEEKYLLSFVPSNLAVSLALGRGIQAVNKMRSRLREEHENGEWSVTVSPSENVSKTNVATRFGDTIDRIAFNKTMSINKISNLTPVQIEQLYNDIHSDEENVLEEVVVQSNNRFTPEEIKLINSTAPLTEISAKLGVPTSTILDIRNAASFKGIQEQMATALQIIETKPMTLKELLQAVPSNIALSVAFQVSAHSISKMRGENNTGIAGKYNLKNSKDLFGEVILEFNTDNKLNLVNITQMTYRQYHAEYSRLNPSKPIEFPIALDILDAKEAKKAKDVNSAASVGFTPAFKVLDEAQKAEHVPVNETVDLIISGVKITVPKGKSVTVTETGISIN